MSSDFAYGWFIIDRETQKDSISKPIFRTREAALEAVRGVVEKKYQVFYWDQPGHVASGTYLSHKGYEPECAEDIKSLVQDFIIR